ncbi:MAG: hypothetical protein ACI9GW_003217, partial [Halieaceae bacterium]
VNIVLNEGESNQLIKSVPFGISESTQGSTSPGSSGPSWRTIATVNLVNGTIN